MNTVDPMVIRENPKLLRKNRQPAQPIRIHRLQYVSTNGKADCRSVSRPPALCPLLCCVCKLATNSAAHKFPGYQLLSMFKVVAVSKQADAAVFWWLWRTPHGAKLLAFISCLKVNLILLPKSPACSNWEKSYCCLRAWCTEIAQGFFVCWIAPEVDSSSELDGELSQLDLATNKISGSQPLLLSVGGTHCAGVVVIILMATTEWYG